MKRPSLACVVAVLGAWLVGWWECGAVPVELAWDPGDTQAGTQAVGQPDTLGGSYLYRVVVPVVAGEGMRVRLEVGAGEADLYLKQGAEPTTTDYHQASAQPGGDLIVVQPGGYGPGQEWFILVEAGAGAEWSLLCGDAAVPLAWDPGETHEGTAVYQHPGGGPGMFWFRVAPQSLASGAWRNALTVVSGEADLYWARGRLPFPGSADHGSARAGSDGFMVRPDEFQPGEDCFLLVHVGAAASWSLVSGEAYVMDLGALRFADADADGTWDPGEEPLESGSGPLAVGPEGARLFKATVPPGTPAWCLWLGGLPNDILVRRNTAPFANPASPFAFAERVQAGRMLLVPDYLQAAADTYFIAVPGDPGTALDLRSRIHGFTDAAFGSTRTVACDGGDAGYRTFRIEVPVDQIAWENESASLTGDAAVWVRRDRVGNEFHNDALADAAGAAVEGVTLAPPTLTNGTFFVTVSGAGVYQASWRNGGPVVTGVPFTGAVVNDVPGKSGWRYYVVTDIGSQFGLGWELELEGAPAGTEIAIRRNAVPARWLYRDSEQVEVTASSGHVDHSSATGLLQQVDHQSDIWYIGVYNPHEALGEFTLTQRLATAEGLGFDGVASAQAGHRPGAWRWFRVDVPAGPAGWDLRVRDVTAGAPRMAVRRDLLPGDLGMTWWPGHQAAWPSGFSWAEVADITGRSRDPGGVDASYQHLTCGMGRPLEPGTYYVGVLNAGGEPAAYALESRGIGAGCAVPVGELAFEGGSAPIAGLAARDLTVWRVVVPAGAGHWSLRLDPSVGEMMMAVLHGAVPGGGGLWYTQPFAAAPTPGVRVRKAGAEFLSLFPDDTGETLPAGDYFIVVMSEGEAPADDHTVGTGAASGTLSSAGAPVQHLGPVAVGAPVSVPVALEGGQTKVFTVDVPPATATLEIRLDGRSGNPHVSARPGLAAARPLEPPWYEDYGYHVGRGSDYHAGPSLLTFANPPAGPFTITVRARHADGDTNLFEPATATLVAAVVPPTPVDFDGGTAAVAAQQPGGWSFFRIEVPDGPRGWDLRLRDVAAGTPRMVVRRDLLPDAVTTHDANGSVWFPGHQAAWPSGWQWAEQADLTGRLQDPGGVDAAYRHVTCGMGRPLEPGTYFVGVHNAGAEEADYTLESRGIGAGCAVPVADVPFAGGAAGFGGLAARDLVVARVVVPEGASHWLLQLEPTAGEAMMAVLGGTVPGGGGLWHNQPFEVSGQLSPGVRMRKPGAEFLGLFPDDSRAALPAGEYFIAVLSEGEAPPDAGTVGAGAASGTLTSLGAAVAALGPVAAGAPLSVPVALAGGQARVFTVEVAPGTATLEVRLDGRSGNPHVAARPGGVAPRPLESPVPDDYGYYVGHSSSYHAGPAVLTFANPPAGPFTITVRARHEEWDAESFPDAACTLVVTALPPTAVGFDGGTAAVSGQEPGAWAFFRIDVPDGPLGWDLRLRDVAAGAPRLVVRRDLLPDGVATHTDTGGTWYPGNCTSWPTGWQWAEQDDITGRRHDAGGVDAAYRHLTCGMGRPLEPGTYFVGVHNAGGEAAAYTLESRGIGAGLAVPVGELAFGGGGGGFAGLAARDLAVWRVAVPAGASHWSLRLDPTAGEAMMAVLQGTVPSGGALSYNQPFAAQPWPGVRVQKQGAEFLSLFPDDSCETLPGGDYFVVVMSEGEAPPDQFTTGAGAASGTLHSTGAPVQHLGQVADGAPVSAPVVLAGGQTLVFTVEVAPATATLQLRLDSRTGNPYLAGRPGGAAPRPLEPAWHDDYGYYVGHTTGYHAGPSVLTFANPPAGPFTITVRARAAEWDAGQFPDASATLVVTALPPAPLNFGSYANPGGGSNQDSRQLIDGETVLYQVQTAAAVDGVPVLGWKVDAALAQGDLEMKFFRDPVSRAEWFATTLDTAVAAPPFFTPGDTWYLEVTGIGITDYTVASEPVTLAREAWQMPPAGQLSSTPGLAGSTTFGDSGIDAAGAPLPGDQGIDLGQDDWHFYAVEVPAGNRGVLRTVIEALNGNPDLYLRRGGVPTTPHGANPPWPSGLYDYCATGAATDYDNWVPVDARSEHELAPGTWFLGVTAAGGTNCRYRLRAGVGDFQALALDGGTLTGQQLVGGDWRYYRLEVPQAAPLEWQVTFSIQQGNVEVHWRQGVPPGDTTGLLTPDPLRNAADDWLNQGPYDSAGWGVPGTCTVPSPPLRPNSPVWLGVRAAVDATFAISSAVGGGALPVPPELDFFSGRFEGEVPVGDGLVFRVAAPPEATRLWLALDNPGDVELRVEQGAWPTVAGAAHWAWGPGIAGLSLRENLSAASWPWQPGRTYYLRLVNHGAAAAPVAIQLDGRTALTEDDNDDGIADWWQRLHFGDAWWWAATPDGDPDGDGRNSLLEAVFGSDPNGADAASVLVAGTEGPPVAAVLTFALAEPFPAAATVVVEASDDLREGTWLPIATRDAGGAWSGTALVGQSPPAGGRVTVTVRDQAHAGSPVRFARLRVIR